MKLTKAIEIIQLKHNTLSLLGDPDEKMALHIALETMKFAQLTRIVNKSTVPSLFHGETVD